MARELAIGQQAPDFTLPAAAGGHLSLAEFRGRPVLLVFLRWLG